MRAITPIIFSSLLALAIVHNALAATSEGNYMDSDTSVSKNPFGLARRPKVNAGGTRCDMNTNQGSCQSDECEWSNGHWAIFFLKLSCTHKRDIIIYQYLHYLTVLYI